jgi:hypothetical protein
MSLPAGTYDFIFADELTIPQSSAYTSVVVPAGDFDLDAALKARQTTSAHFSGSRVGVSAGTICAKQNGTTHCSEFTAVEPARFAVSPGAAVVWVLDSAPAPKIKVQKTGITLASGENDLDVALASASSTGGGAAATSTGGDSGTAPRITGVDPPSITEGSPAQELKIIGSNLGSATATLNDQPLHVISQGDGVIAVYLAAEDLKTAGPAQLKVSDGNGGSATATLIVAPWSSRFTRIYLGIEDKGASSTDAQAELLVGADTEAEIGSKSSFYFWLSPRLTSLAQKDPASAVGVFDSSYLASAFGGSVSKLVHAFEFEAGPELVFGSPQQINKDSDTQTLVALIADFGAITPLSPSELDKSLTVYDGYANEHPGKSCDGSPLTSGTAPPATCSTVFVPESRSRFLYRYGGGVRFKTYYYKDNTLQQRYPGTIDWTFGQDQSVSHGKFAGLTMRLDANYPIPALNGVNIFGTMAMKPFNKSRTYPTILLTPDASLTATSTGVQQISVSQPDRDYFSIGVAFDLSAILKGHS